MEYVDSVVALSRAPSCYKRAQCVQICASLVDGLPASLSRTKVLPALQPLTADRTPNVRLALATLVKNKLLTPDGGPFASDPITVAMTEALRVDSDRDVLRMIHPQGYEPPMYTCQPDPLVAAPA